MSNAVPISLEERKRLAKLLLEEVHYMQEIAVIFGWSRDRLCDEIIRGGGKENYDPYAAQALYERGYFKKKFTQEQKDLIKKMHQDGTGIHLIRNELKCGFQRITTFLDQEGLLKGRVNSLLTLTKRMDALEEQINLIYELMEEKNDS